MTEDIFELINAGVDGELTSEERARLERLRRERPDVAARYDEIASVAGMVTSLERVEPPVGLRDRIVANAIASSTRHIRPHRIGLLDRLLAAVTPKPAFRLAFGFVGGLVLGAFLMTIVPRGAVVDPNNAAGTIGATPGAAQVARLEGSAAAASVALSRTGEVVTATISAADGPATVEITYDPTQAALSGLTGLDAVETSYLESSPGKTVVRLPEATRISLTYAVSPGQTVRLGLNLFEADVIASSTEVSL